MISYRLDLYWQNLRVAQLTTFSNLKYGEKLNDFVDCTFDYNVNYIDLILKQYLTAGLEIRIMRKNDENDESFKNVWAGRLSEEPSYKMGTNGQETLNFKVEHFGNYHFLSRKLTATYTNLEETAIVKDVIDTLSFNGYYIGFTVAQLKMIEGYGSLEITGNLRSKECKKQDLKSILKQLTEVQDIFPNPIRKRGFRLTPDLKSQDYKIFSYLANYGVDSGIVLNNALISELDRGTGGKVANLITAEGKNTSVQSTTTSSAILNFFGLREETVSFKDVINATELQNLSNKNLVQKQTPQIVYSLKLLPNNPTTGLYRAGDLLMIEFTSNYLGKIRQKLRVHEIMIDFDGSNKETTEIKIGGDDPISLNTSNQEKYIYKLNSSLSRLSSLEIT